MGSNIADFKKLIKAIIEHIDKYSGHQI